MPTPEFMARNADFVVLAVAMDYSVSPQEDGQPQWTDSGEIASRIRFEVVETLEGSLPSDTLDLAGVLVSNDDPNDHGPPYRFVRPAGRRGNCWAYEYKREVHYLLFLESRGEGVTVNWYALGPVNEQVSGAQDPWVWWVKGFLAGQEFVGELRTR